MADEEVKRCETCSRKMCKMRGYYGSYYICEYKCTKCQDGCYGFCECSKRRWEYKECRFCETHVPVKEETCDECCEECLGECKYECPVCETTCDTDCDCEINCTHCENKIKRTDFLHEEDYRTPMDARNGEVYKYGPICDDCRGRWCWDDEGPCQKPCKECGGPCDGCSCECPDCGEETTQGGCRCYSDEQIKKDNRDMRKRFENGQEIRHRIKTNVWVVIYHSETNTLQKDDTSYTSLSAFAIAHYKAIGSTRKTVNGWKECEYKDGETWKTTF